MCCAKLFLIYFIKITRYWCNLSQCIVEQKNCYQVFCNRIDLFGKV